MLRKAIYRVRIMYGTASRALRRRLRVMPVYRVLQELANRQVKVEEAVALEVFGGSGDFYTLDLADAVSSMEVWEVDGTACENLARKLPDVTVRQRNSIEEVHHCQSKFDIISIDAYTSTFGREGEFCEHFDLFPGIFRIAEDHTVLIFNVIPEASWLVRRLYPALFNSQHLARRCSFYGTSTPAAIPLTRMIETYKTLAHENGYNLDWWFTQKRSLFLYFLVLHITRKNCTLQGRIVLFEHPSLGVFFAEGKEI